MTLFVHLYHVASDKSEQSALPQNAKKITNRIKKKWQTNKGNEISTNKIAEIIENNAKKIVLFPK